MSISYPPQAQIPVVGPDIVTTIPAVVTSTTLSPANLNRAPSGLIVNNGTKNLWVVFGATAATTAPPSIKVPASGGALDIPGSYTGIVTGIWESGAHGSCVVHEFSYI
jgi:hypothetical protein